MGTPIGFELYLREMNQQLDETDADENVSDPLHKFLESRALAVAGGSAGISAFQKIAPSYKPPVDDTDGNPWLIKHETVNSQKIENDFDEEISGDPRELTKRIGESTRRTQLTAFIKRQLAIGETIESLADYAREHDEETARLILEIGETL